MSHVVLESTGLALAPDSRVDLETGIIRGCKVLGTTSRNRRVYPVALLRERYGVYEGAQVYSDHDYGQLKHGKARPLAQWGGVLRGVRFEGDSVRGDLHCLRETQAGKIILEAATRCSDKFGLSAMHLIDSRKEADGTETVTAILECWSVDAVTRPATTRTLFEEDQTMADDFDPAAGAAAVVAPPPPSIEEAFMILQNAIMADTDLDDQERLGVLKDVMKLKSKVLGTDAESPAEDAAEPAEESHVRPVGRTARTLADLGQAVRALTIRQMAGESLPLDAPTMATLLALPEDAVAGYLDNLRRQRRPRYSAGPARSSGRSVAAESDGSRRAAVPRLTAGADREAVRKWYRG